MKPATAIIPPAITSTFRIIDSQPPQLPFSKSRYHRSIYRTSTACTTRELALRLSALGRLLFVGLHGSKVGLKFLRTVLCKLVVVLSASTPFFSNRLLQGFLAKFGKGLRRAGTPPLRQVLFRHNIGDEGNASLIFMVFIDLDSENLDANLPNRLIYSDDRTGGVVQMAIATSGMRIALGIPDT